MWIVHSYISGLFCKSCFLTATHYLKTVHSFCILCKILRRGPHPATHPHGCLLSFFNFLENLSVFFEFSYASLLRVNFMIKSPFYCSQFHLLSLLHTWLTMKETVYTCGITDAWQHWLSRHRHSKAKYLSDCILHIISEQFLNTWFKSVHQIQCLKSFSFVPSFFSSLLKKNRCESDSTDGILSSV